MQKANPKSTVAPKVYYLNFGMIHCLFRYSTNAEYIKLILEILFTAPEAAGRNFPFPLCLHRFWCSALDLAPPLHVDHLRSSLPHQDRTGLK